MRYINLYWHFIQFSISQSLQFRFDFLIRISMDAMFYALGVFLFKLIYQYTDTIGGWIEADMMVFLGTFYVVDALHMTLYANNLWNLPRLINRGDLDYYLVRPVSTLFFISLRDFALDSFVDLMIAISFLSWAIYQHSHSFSLEKYALFFLALFNGTFVHYLLYLLSQVVVFWTHSPNGWTEIFWPMSQLAERPDHIYKGWLRTFLTKILPFSLIASYPARILIEPFSWDTVLTLVFVTSYLTIFALSLWRRGLRSYSSASS